jgi:hypothetical protein
MLQPVLAELKLAMMRRAAMGRIANKADVSARGRPTGVTNTLSSALVPPTTPQPESPTLRVSVVLVAYNCEPALRRALGALEASHTREQLEILVVDAGSDDDCPRVDIEFPKVTVLRLPRNFGRTRARNIGVRTARAELILFLDPHVEVRPETVERLVTLAETHDEATAVAPRLLNPAGEPIETAFRLPAPADLAAVVLNRALLPRSPAGESAEAVDELALLVKKSFLGGMNYLDEKRFSEYWSLLEVCWQIRNAGKKILFADTTATLHPAEPLAVDETLYTSDCALGAAAYVSKHFGFGAGLAFRFGRAFAALISGRPGLAWSIVNGMRLDPTQ